jgi:hypothetical protein
MLFSAPRNRLDPFTFHNAFNLRELIFAPGREKPVPCPVFCRPKNLTVIQDHLSIWNVAKNQHRRWKNWLSEQARIVLEESAGRLNRAWAVDKKRRNSYPRNTDREFSLIHDRLGPNSRVSSRIEQHDQELPSPPPAPASLSDLLHEKTVKAIFEEQNGGSYEDALRLAIGGEPKGAAAWRKILQALNAAFLTRYYGDDFIPKPRVQFLHRNVLELAAVVEIDDVKYEALAEFFDDLCPCGERHKPDAVRKLRKRWQDRKPPTPEL